jgi:hypothetical protein
MLYRLFARTALSLSFLRIKRRFDVKRASAAFILLFFTSLTILNSFHHHQGYILSTSSFAERFNKNNQKIVRFHKENPEQECAACEWAATGVSTFTTGSQIFDFNDVSQPYLFRFQQNTVIKTDVNREIGRAPPVV